MITSLKALRSLARQGVRIAALTWNFSNHIASGVLEPDKNRGLTEFGETVVREMNRINMLIDYSHLNDKSFFDIANISNAPIIATHSNSRAVCRHPRNLTDEQFRPVSYTHLDVYKRQVYKLPYAVKVHTVRNRRSEFIA